MADLRFLVSSTDIEYHKKSVVLIDEYLDVAGQLRSGDVTIFATFSDLQGRRRYQQKVYVMLQERTSQMSIVRP